MRNRLRLLIAISFSLAVLAATGPSLHAESRFAEVTVPDPEWRLNAKAEPPEQLEGFEARRAGWQVFKAENGDWKIHVDTRTGVPLLAEGAGIPFAVTDGSRSVKAQLESRALEFITDHREAFGVNPAEFVLDANSDSPDGHHWQLVFHREVEGIPVEGESFLFFVNFGKLVSFGATRWGTIEAVPEIKYSGKLAREALYRHMRLTARDHAEDRQAPRLVFVATPPDGDQGQYRGPVGEGVRYRLAWRFLVQVSGESGVWSAAVDASSGEVISFYDTVVSSEVKGGVYGISSDQNCPDGCEKPDHPMPYADVTPDGQATLYAGGLGVFSCGDPDPIATALAGDQDPLTAGGTVVIDEGCPGDIYETADDCSHDIDVGYDTGTDCDSTGASLAARTSYYHATRILEKARGWWPTTPWAQGLDLDVEVNRAAQCNAHSVTGSLIRFYKESGVCQNSGEVPGIIHHEAGHSIDRQDSSVDWDRPAEGTADAFAMLQGRTSCIGHGFVMQGLCHNRFWYGYSCDECTGIREMDTAKRNPSTPATATWLKANAPYTGDPTPCGFQSHWEGHLTAEAIYDLAARELPAMGMDEESAWQLAEKLFYLTRGAASNSNTYNCVYDQPSGIWRTDGCNASSWYNRFRAVDDDGDGTANGTPHAAAIFEAFDRHGIACHGPNDPENQNQSACSGSVDPPKLTVRLGPDSRTLEWTPIPDAAEYLVGRNDLGCGYSFNIIARTSDTSYVDEGVPEGLEVYYRVQAVTSTALSTGSCPAPIDFNCGGPDCLPQPGFGDSKVPTGLISCVDRGSGAELTCDPGEEIHIETTKCEPRNPGPPFPVCARDTSRVVCAPTELCESPVSNCAPCAYPTQYCPVEQGLDCGDGCQTAMLPPFCPVTSYGGGSCLTNSGDVICCSEGKELSIKTCECKAIGVFPPDPVPVCLREVSTMVCR